MKRLCLALALLGAAPAVQAQRPAAVFDAPFQSSHRGKMLVEVPEVYELVNVAIALTPTAIESKNLVYQRSDYYARVRAWFEPFRQHRLIVALDAALKRSPNAYFTIKMNGYAFEFDATGTIVQSRIYDRTGFRGEATNTLRPFLGDLQSFAAASRFREFYRNNARTYAEQAAFYERQADVGAMKKWLDANFPGSRHYDLYRIVFSPLVYGNQSTTWFESNGFRELQPHVNYPYPEDVQRWGVGRIGPESAILFRGLIVFTEINHGYINPEADKYADRIRRVVSNRAVWVGDRHGDAYYRGIASFNEYMNWALVSLWFADHAPAADRAAMIAAVEKVMTESRAFPQFAAFDRFLLELYRSRKPGETLADLYPRIISWFEQRNAQ
jgi:hypothetical protein